MLFASEPFVSLLTFCGLLLLLFAAVVVVGTLYERR
jgi:hypothetical protein